jgi:Tfp pilus assembly protein PilF
MNQKEKAANDLIKASQLDRKDPRIKYNLATYYFQEKQYNKAVPVIKEAISIEPQNPDYKYLLALIYQAQEKNEAYQLIMNELNQ